VLVLTKIIYCNIPKTNNPEQVRGP